MQKLAQDSYLKAVLSAIYQLNHYMDYVGKSSIPHYMMSVVTKILPEPFDSNAFLREIAQELLDETRIKRSNIKYLRIGVCHDIYLELDLAIESGAGFGEIKLVIQNALFENVESKRINRANLIAAINEVIEERHKAKVWAKKSNKIWRRKENTKAKKIAREGALQLLGAYCKLAQACRLSDEQFKNHILSLTNRRGIKLEQEIL